MVEAAGGEGRQGDGRDGDDQGVGDGLCRAGGGDGHLPWSGHLGN